MQTLKEINLSSQFKLLSKKILNKQPDIYLSNFIKDKTLYFNTNTFKKDDMPFIEIFFSLPFKNISIFQQYQPPKKRTSKENQKENLKSMDKKFHETSKFYELLKSLISFIGQNKLDSLRVLKFQNIPMSVKCFFILSSGIQKTKYLKELVFKKCSIKDSHLQAIKKQLAMNVSLTYLDLSYNQLKQSGGMIGKILSQHSQRKNDILYMYSIRKLKPQFDLSNTGICEVNLEGNQFNNKSIQDLITFLQDDKWTRYINLKDNKIGQQGIKKFVLMLNNNKSIMNLDLRENEGLTKQYSKLIFKKLKENIQDYKKSHLRDKKNQQLNIKMSTQKQTTAQPIIPYTSRTNTQNLKQNNHYPKINSFKQFNKASDKNLSLINKSKSKQKKKLYLDKVKAQNLQKMYHSQNNKNYVKNISQIKEVTTLGSKEMVSHQLSDRKNMNQTHENVFKNINTSQNKGQVSQFQDQGLHQCKNCKQMALRALKAQKANLQLEIQLKKLKNFLSKNLDISIIGSSSNKLNLSSINKQNISNQHQVNIRDANFSISFNKMASSQNQDELISRMEVLMSQLTKIMQTAELGGQNTHNTIQHAFENINSLSKTVSLYQKPKQLYENQQQIQQDEALHLQQFGQNSVSMIQKNGIKEQSPNKICRNTS